MDPVPNEVEILLVEDNPTDAELAITALQERNLANKLFWVKDGAEALDFLFGTGIYAGHRIESGPKVVLLDLRLPKVDGQEVLRRIKADERTKALPVVVMTSSQEDRDVVDSYKHGVNSYITKPVDFDRFAEVVVQLGLYWLLFNRPPVREKK
ncbi:MAG: response regulator [Rhodocyclaceae bacterium]|nr:response regulator [Rhodocyclaceae bacterium]